MKPPKTPTDAPPAPALWHPTWRWHLKTLAVVYVVLTAVFFAVDRFLANLPEPYRLRDIPKEMTPWLKK